MKPNTVHSGFTLVELVIVIVVMGLLAGMAALLLKPAIQSYLAVQRRAGMTDQADTALRRIGRDVRSAVANSIRTPNNQCFEFVPTSTGGRYRLAPDTQNVGDTALDTSQPSTGFDVLGPMSATPAAGDYVVIDNQNTNDVYSGGNAGSNPGVRATITSVTTPAAVIGASHININSQQFPSGYQGGRFVVVPANGGNPAVSYVCSGIPGSTNGTGNMTLYRVTRAFNAAFPTSCPATTGAAIQAINLSQCNFIYNANEGKSQQSGFVWMQMTMTQAGESIALAYGVHVDNVP